MAGDLKKRLARIRAAGIAEDFDCTPVPNSQSGGVDAFSRRGSEHERIRDRETHVMPQCLAGWERADDMVWVRDVRRTAGIPHCDRSASFLFTWQPAATRCLAR